MMEEIPQALERREFLQVEEVDIMGDFQSVIQTMSRLKDGKQRVSVGIDAGAVWDVVDF